MQRWVVLRRFTEDGNVTDREIYEQVRGPLMRFAASLVGPDAASDLVSEVVVATLQSRSLVSLENPRAYLMQAVLNRARSAGRRLDRERLALARYPVVDLGEDPVDFQVGGSCYRTFRVDPRRASPMEPPSAPITSSFNRRR